MLLTIVVVLAVVIGGLLAFAATRPDTFQVQRSATLAAPAERIFPYLNDFHQWGAWSPWEKIDPDLKRTFSGAEQGTGAIYEWVGNKNVGQGRMEILESAAPSRLRIQLDFIKPFEAHNITSFALAPADGGTRVNWVMDGNHNFMSKVMCIFMDMDKMVGKDFEKGLANLKSVTETEPAAQPV